MPAVVRRAAIPPSGTEGDPWRLREPTGACRDVSEMPGDAVAAVGAFAGRSRSPIFGEWSPAGFRPLSLLPDDHGGPFSADIARTGGVSGGGLGRPGDHGPARHRPAPVPTGLPPSGRDRQPAIRPGPCWTRPPGTAPRSGPAFGSASAPAPEPAPASSRRAGAARGPAGDRPTPGWRRLSPGSTSGWPRPASRDASLAPEHWTAAANLAARSRRGRPAAAGRALGERGVWFVGQNPEWARLAARLRAAPGRRTPT